MQSRGRSAFRTAVAAVAATALIVALSLAGSSGASAATAGPAPAAAPATAALAAATPGGYLIGAGIGDITGEAAEVGMMGYADSAQKTSGIHQRQHARAFVVADPASGRRVALVTTDTLGAFQSVTQEVIRRLTARFGSRYNDRNVLIAATHTHATPGGASHYALYDITILGYQAATFEANVAGIVDAIAQAEATLRPGGLSIGSSTLTTAGVNRSMPAFSNNPAADRAAFPQAIDPQMSVLRFTHDATATTPARDIGMMSWFGTHATSLSPANTLISGDNKGYAAYAWERLRQGVNYRSTTAPSFVAAFAQSNAGDVSANLALKPGTGPTTDMFRNAEIIGTRQLDAATTAYTGATPTGGGLDYRMRYVDMSKVTVAPAFTTDGRSHTTCPAALGSSFAAGAEDGPGPGIAAEGQRNPFVAALGGLVFSIPQSLRTCQAPKEVIVPTGLTKPYPWSPEMLPVQLMRLGELYLIGVPAEFTIVSGLRMRKTVAAELNVPLQNVVLAGYANAYAGYVTTPEEYERQDYEGGSTHFGKWTLGAYQQTAAGLAAAMRTGAAAPKDDGTPRDLRGKLLNFQTGVVMDTALAGFGAVRTQPAASYRRGTTATVEFWTGHPKNNLHRGGTFLEVQRLNGSTWVTVADDNDWDTRYQWTRNGIAQSIATITWQIPATAATGTYRVVHRGESKSLFGVIRSFTGTSRSFTVS